MTAAQSLPRFLLPRLSWTGPSGSITGASAALLQQARDSSNASLSRQPPHKRTYHTFGPSKGTPTTIPKRSLTAHFRASPPCFSQNQGRPFSTTPSRQRDHHFDTLRFVQRLQEEGFTEEQAVAMMKVLNDVIEESIQNLTRTMVPREEAAKTTYTQKVDFAKLRSELLSADSTESNTTRAAHERLTNDIAKLSSRLRDEIGRTQASVRLDLNLEKGRIREEAVSQELKIKETETKIEQEVAALRQQLEQVKFQTLQWLMGVCTGFAALMLGAWRLLM
ncbi:Protein fmp32, mitochondrial [Podospora pseudopauciseta]|uniref:Protein fmp32, mitochondrial n=2 Tax=Podospora TaxID=5144 RepID=A0ABR0HYV2_9PEZI|nr:Protein fmp32, mitochondrial [Podospora pseudopauciseta]KAK4681545.1 Protein fmp32, mitochondrial [Podospora pseudoanserina]